MKFSFKFYISAQNCNWSDRTCNGLFMGNPFGLVLYICFSLLCTSF